MDPATLSHLYGNPPPTGESVFGAACGIPPRQPPQLPMRAYRPHNLNQPFNLRERLAKSDEFPLMGLLSVVPSLDTIRIIASVGYDFIVIDWEHTPMNIREVCDLVRLIQMSSEGNTAAVVRLPNSDHHHIAWVLDAGASGVILPHVETAQDAENMVKMCRFPTSGQEGLRSYPPGFIPGIYDGVSDGKTRWDVWNSVAVIIQIESALGTLNADAIAAVPGVDCLMLGNADLRMDLDLPLGLDGGEKVYTDCVNRLLAAARKHNLTALVLTTGPDNALKRIEQGFRALLLVIDGWGLATAVRTALVGGDKAVQVWRDKRAQKQE